MTESKTENKEIYNKCAYVLQKGENAGKKCNKNCRDKYCKDHKKDRKQYKAKYFQEKKNEKKKELLEDKLKKIKEIFDIQELPKIEDLERKQKSYQDDILFYMKRKAGIEMFLGFTKEEATEPVITYKFGKCKCEDLNKEINKKNEKILKIERSLDTDPKILKELKKRIFLFNQEKEAFFRKCEEEYYVNPDNVPTHTYYKGMTDSKIYKMVRKELLKEKREELGIQNTFEIKKCHRCENLWRQFHFMYLGDKDKAKAKIKKLDKKIQICKDKFKNKGLMIKAIKEHREELLKEDNPIITKK